MGYDLVRNGSTDYAVHWETIERLNRSFRLAEATLDSARTVAINDSSWYNPFSWNLPTIYNVEVDWEEVRKSAAILSNQDMLSCVGSPSIPEVGYQMLWRIQQTHEKKARFRDLVASASANNQKNIASAVDSYDGLVDASKFVRDTSFDLVGVGATILTGGAAATGWLGASAVLKGAAKYQDTGRVGLATAQFAGSFVFGAFKIGPKLGFSKLAPSGEYVLVLCQGVYEGGMSLAAGDTFSKAVQKGTLKVVGDGGSKFLMNTELAKSLVEKMPIPMNVWVNVERNKWVDEANAIVAKGLEKTGANAVSKVAGPAVFNRLISNRAGAEPAAGVLADDAAVGDEMLLNFAIINMEKGVGRGW